MLLRCVRIEGVKVLIGIMKEVSWGVERGFGL